jgi:RNA polymerase sigma factor (sigma-70 family)
MERMADPAHPPIEASASSSARSTQVARWARDYAEDLRRFLAKRRIIESDIKDVCQEVYLRLLRFDRTEAVKNPAAYLFRIAANVAHDFKLRRPECVPLEPEDLDRMPGDLSAEELAASAAKHRTLFRAIEALPPVPRAALALQAREDLSHEQIAQRLGISRRALRKAITRGHELLRVALEDF